MARAQPLAGKVIVLDAGHQLGNHNFPEEINRLVPAGGFTKPCNTTGTATNGGYPEATLVAVPVVLQGFVKPPAGTSRLISSGKLWLPSW